MGKWIEQQVSGHENVLVAGDVVVNLNQLFASLENFEDLDQAIDWLRSLLVQTEKKIDKLDNWRFFFLALAASPVFILFIAAAMTSFLLAGLSLTLTLSALLPLNRIRVKMALVLIDSQAIRKSLHTLIENQIFRQITEIKPWQKQDGPKDPDEEETREPSTRRKKPKSKFSKANSIGDKYRPLTHPAKIMKRGSHRICLPKKQKHQAKICCAKIFKTVLKWPRFRPLDNHPSTNVTQNYIIFLHSFFSPPLSLSVYFHT